ncbi:hypothetical protein HMPREF0972_00587 [Actinomyces sp. oral taxon 848 str. F0332]|nr:hypothetical protein HMPREF0972_00587 [Actinomyces sp. oral taxon 848 str. F0332]
MPFALASKTPSPAFASAALAAPTEHRITPPSSTECVRTAPSHCPRNSALPSPPRPRNSALPSPPRPRNSALPSPPRTALDAPSSVSRPTAADARAAAVRLRALAHQNDFNVE